MKINLLLIITLMLAQVVLGQRKSRADRFFEKRDYINAAIKYEEELNNEGYSKPILKNISESYFRSFQFREAYRYLKILTSGKFYQKDKTYENKYNFMMYHTLSSLGKYEKAVDYLELYAKNNGESDFDKTSVIQIIESFKLKDDDYKITLNKISADASEFGAVKLKDTLYFSSDRNPNFLGKSDKWTHRSFLDIYKVAVNEKNDPIADIEEISSKINSKLHEGNFCFSPDGNTLYFSKSNITKGKKKFDSLKNNAVYLYTSQKVGGVWQEPKKLPFNKAEYSIEHPTITSDGTKMYFSSNMPGGQGGFDIYEVSIEAGNVYGTPKNLGAVINTPHREQFPFVDKEGHLFFSSNGHLGLGMMDIFVSELKHNQLAVPVNLGAPINSGYDDFSLTYYDNENGFFASNRKNKIEDDVFNFSQVGEIFAKAYEVRFEVKDFASNNYVPNAKITIQNPKGSILFSEQMDSIASLTKSVFAGRYDFKVSADGYESNIKPIYVKEKTAEVYTIYLERIPSEIANNDPKKEDVSTTKKNPMNLEKRKLTPEELRKKLLQDTFGPQVVERNGKLYFDLPPIHFEYNKWNIRPDSKKVLDELAKKLDKYRSVYIHIDSHTDSRGTDEYNQMLSEKRAEATRNYLALIGYVNARRMKFKGYGESKPIIDCKSKECSEQEHQTNRRSEFEIVKY